ncbi:HigA family addiction module antitoxin [Alkanindiges illinoisensis]|uniref:Addiction module antidote protein, HigA family n=1 Tax=Alkanindiges illinoisensis TaxID=197183 RepID=A0A4Y7X9K7_9GAMM|nr:HigA family addiction module antitoxin [Alkanindiges illinoisensis]TEU23362.1 addiction module antidote protein, HigA family [Alkanindiges illinoisensis]
MFNPPHVGEVLREYIDQTPIEIVAKESGLSIARLSDVLAGNTAITPDDANGLAKALNTSSQFWLDLQAQYESKQSADL